MFKLQSVVLFAFFILSALAALTENPNIQTTGEDWWYEVIADTSTHDATALEKLMEVKVSAAFTEMQAQYASLSGSQKDKRMPSVMSCAYFKGKGFILASSIKKSTAKGTASTQTADIYDTCSEGHKNNANCGEMNIIALAKTHGYGDLGTGDYITSWNKYGSFAPCGDPEASTSKKTNSGKTLAGCYQKLSADHKGLVVFYQNGITKVTKTLTRRRAERAARMNVLERDVVEFVIV